MQWWIWIARWFLFYFRYSRLYRIKKETLTTILAITVYINRSNNKSFLEIKDGELKTLVTMKLFAIAKHLIEKTENGKNLPSFEIAEVDLVQ